jgi:hypothetical protein
LQRHVNRFALGTWHGTSRQDSQPSYEGKRSLQFHGTALAIRCGNRRNFDTVDLFAWLGEAMAS